ncbi:MAG TPA: thiol:disulfide interchange protein DsbA/DsbL [Burkholderiales bacterium]|nr:thiol:disulfide interchange protein DsbA/DsbL [Burkholderiales bacterium]
MTAIRPCRAFRWLLAAALAGAAAAAPAQEVISVRQNIEYRLIAQQPVETGDRIEVIDFFWYGCPFCNQLQPALEAWIRRKPEDVALRRVPVILRESWVPHARIYYTLELLGEVERLHLKVYHGYHVEELHMSKPEVMEQWAVRNGIDRRRWLDAYYSPEVDAKVARARVLTERYEVRGTPTLVVDGRYLTSGDMAPTLAGMIPIMEDLVRLARQRRAGK